MFRGASLLKVDVIMMALALGVVICAVVVSVALRDEPGRTAEVATKLLGEPPWYSLGAEGNAAEKFSAWRALLFGEVLESFLPSIVKKWPCGICAVLIQTLHCFKLVLAKGQEEDPYPQRSAHTHSAGPPRRPTR